LSEEVIPEGNEASLAYCCQSLESKRRVLRSSTIASLRRREGGENGRGGYEKQLKREDSR
jgi:hypothetical protein